MKSIDIKIYSVSIWMLEDLDQVEYFTLPRFQHCHDGAGRLISSVNNEFLVLSYEPPSDELEIYTYHVNTFK